MKKHQGDFRWHPSPLQYDAMCAHVLTATGAKAVLLVVASGLHGDGFAAQGKLAYLLGLPAVLEDVAKQLRDGMSNGGLKPMT